MTRRQPATHNTCVYTALTSLAGPHAAYLSQPGVLSIVLKAWE